MVQRRRHDSTNFYGIKKYWNKRIQRGKTRFSHRWEGSQLNFQIEQMCMSRDKDYFLHCQITELWNNFHRIKIREPGGVSPRVWIMYSFPWMQRFLSYGLIEGDNSRREDSQDRSWTFQPLEAAGEAGNRVSLTALKRNRPRDARLPVSRSVRR